MGKLGFCRVLSVAAMVVTGAAALTAPASPSVSVVPLPAVQPETDTAAPASVRVLLSEPFTETVVVSLSVSPTNSAINGGLVLATNAVRFLAGETQKVVTCSAKDGTDQSAVFGFTVEPVVSASPAAASYYAQRKQAAVFAVNAVPVILHPMSSTNVSYTVPQGVPWAFSWIASDVAADQPTLCVTWTFGDGGTAVATGAVGTVSHAYSETGVKTVRMTARDKDGGQSEVSFLVSVAPTRTVSVTPIGPNASAHYWNAAGQGNGWISALEALNSQNRSDVYTFRYNSSALSSTLSAVPFKAGTSGYVVTNYDASGAAVPGERCPYDSFFYVWAGEGQGLSPAKLDPATTTPAVVIELNDAGRAVQAVFSREYRVADNVGDINQDGIPDKIARRYNLPAAALGGGITNIPPELVGVGVYNGDLDYLPLNPAGAGGTFDFRPVASSVTGTNGLPENAFTAFLEVRGFHPGLNSGEFGSEPDYDPDENRGDEPGTDPTLADTDGDGFPDGWEYYFLYNARFNDAGGVAYNPSNVAAGTPIITKLVILSFDPCTAAAQAASRDLDNDGLKDIDELALGSNPIRWDTDGDGMADGRESEQGLNPLDPRDGRPVITPADGSEGPFPMVVRLSTADGAEVRYTLDGSAPTETSALYQDNAPVALMQSATVTARAFRPGMVDLTTVSASYTVYPGVAQPEIFPETGRVFTNSLEVSMACSTEGATIRYTLDGSEPTATSEAYAGPFTLKQSATCKAKAFKERMTASGTAVSYYHTPSVLYVDASRPDDSGDGVSWASAKKSLQGAVDAAFDGDTVLVTNGVYNVGSAAVPDCLLRNRVAIMRAITVKSVNGASVTVIEGSGADKFGTAAALRCVYMSRGVLDGFTLQGGSTLDDSGEVSDVLGAGAYVADGTVIHCIVTNNAALFGGGVAGGRLVGSVVWANRARMGGAGLCDVSAHNCVVAGNEGSGSVGCSLYNSVIWGNTTPFDEGGLPLEMVNCLADTYTPRDEYVGVITGDPRFADAAGGDFRLRFDSPCRDAGDNAYVLDAADLAGGARIINGTVDMGAYESQVVSLPPAVAGLSPTNALITVSEGASVAFRMTADDSADPDAAARGMSNVAWFVDGALRQTTPAVGTNAVLSAFTLKTDSSTVQGVASQECVVRAVALDRQGLSSSAVWTVRVANVPVSQTVTFGALPAKVIGDADFDPGAASSSGLPVVYSSSNESVALVAGDTLRIVGAGTAQITASRAADFDFTAAAPVKQTLTVKARLAALVNGGGAVTGAGLYMPGAKVSLAARPAAGQTFLRWENGAQTPSRSLVMPNANVTVSAWFAPTTNIAPPAVADPGPQRAMVGVPFNLPLSISSDSLPTVTVSGLPTGLKYVAATAAIVGVPSAAVVDKPVKVVAKNVSLASSQQVFLLTVEPLSAWAQGAFNGTADHEALGGGVASMTVSARGAATGKLTLRGTNYGFSAASYAARDEQGVFALTATAKVGKVAWPLSLRVAVPAVTGGVGVASGTLAKAEGSLGSNGWVSVYRNVWKDPGMAAVAAPYAGYYTAALPGCSEYGSGYLLFTVDAAGGVKAAGKLADGTAVSQSATLILDEGGRAFAVLYVAPSAYKGGGLFGLAELFRREAGGRVIVRPLDGGPLLWQSLNPQATQSYGEGFSRALDLVGGWYDKVGNLFEYYRGHGLSTGVDGAAVAPELAVAANRVVSAWWSPGGLALAAVTNAQGVMTGLAAPAAGAPVDPDQDNVWDYGAENTVGLRVSLTRATGVFTGSFRAWFDYGSTHTSRSVAFVGVLTPERADKDDGVAGRGCFLWPDKGAYQPSFGAAKPYSFNWSYDLKILISEPAR